MKWHKGECEGGFGAGGILGCQVDWAEAMADDITVLCTCILVQYHLFISLPHLPVSIDTTHGEDQVPQW